MVSTKIDLPQLADDPMDRDWQTEYPFLDWQPNGHLRLDIDDDGALCFPVKQNAKLPPEVREHLTHTVTFHGGVGIEEPLLPFNSPPLRAYKEAGAQRRAMLFAAMRKGADTIHDYISDIENTEPIPRSILRKRPESAEWLNGENQNYAPTPFEFYILRPAFIERRRKLRELGLVNNSSLVEVGRVPETTTPMQHTEGSGQKTDSLSPSANGNVDDKFPAICSSEGRILSFLYERYPLALIQEEIVAGVGDTRKTVKKYLDTLADKQLIDVLPAGRNSVITDLGRELVGHTGVGLLRNPA